MILLIYFKGEIYSSLIHFYAGNSGNEYIFMIVLVITGYGRFRTPNSYQIHISLLTYDYIINVNDKMYMCAFK